jgi:MOSC domain-containing protein YiiM
VTPEFRFPDACVREFWRFLAARLSSGDLGENITTYDLDLERMPIGTLIQLGPFAIIELAGLRTHHVLMDHFRAGLKRHVPSSAEMGPPFKSGVLGVVRAGGTVAPGDTARIGPRPLRFVPTCLVGAVHDA